jgi:nucleoside-diphosphate-sugar epimerase
MDVLITGANGFLGKYLKSAFEEQKPITLGLSGCDYNVDLSSTVPCFSQSFDKVVHAAGLAHLVPKSKESARRFFDVNVTGTSNLLKALEQQPDLPEQFILISTVAVYGIETGLEIDESAPLNGFSPYALSKISAEEMLRVWGVKNNVSTLILRLPLLAGSNPPGNLGAMFKAIKSGFYFRIGDGWARKSMVLASDVAEFISTCRDCSGTYNLTDGHHPSLWELDQAIASSLNRRIRKIPTLLIKFIARLGDFIPFIPIYSMKFKKLTSSLTFSDARARREIGWQSKPVVENLQF